MREVDVAAERFFDGRQIGAETVRGQLDAAGETVGQVTDECTRRDVSARADVPAWNQIRVGVDRSKRVNVARPFDRNLGRRDAALLAKLNHYR